MRVTEGTGYRNLLRDLARVQERMEKAQQEISSGKKVSTPSDDPSMASDIIRLTGERSEADQYGRNLRYARSNMELADAVLDSVERMVERVRTLGLSALGGASANLYTTEVSGIRDQILSAANTSQAGRFIFGGSLTTGTPYTKSADGLVTYNGNDEKVEVQVGRSSTLQMQIPGSEIFNGSVNIFAAMSDLVTAMSSGERSAIDAQIKKIEKFAEAVSVSRSKVGGYLNIATTFENELASGRLAREADLNAAQAADLAKAITEFRLSENALQATMTVGARISQLNLLDYL